MNRLRTLHLTHLRLTDEVRRELFEHGATLVTFCGLRRPVVSPDKPVAGVDGRLCGNCERVRRQRQGGDGG